MSRSGATTRPSKPTGRALEKLLDTAHLPFVHRWSIGAGMRRALRDDSHIVQAVQPTANGFTAHWNDDERVVFIQHVWCAPMEANTTELHLVSERGFCGYNPTFWLTDSFNVRIAWEDKAITESRWPPEVPEPQHERSVRTDRSTLTFRRWYLAQLQGTSAAPRIEGDASPPRPTWPRDAARR